MRFTVTKSIVLICMTLLVVSSVLFTACESCEYVIDDDMTPAEYFNRAQNATNKMCYSIAISYYQEFLKAYPNNIEKGAWAEYQIAFLNHKMGEDELALELLNALLNRYQSDTSGELPEAPKTLALKVKANIEKKMQQ